MSRLAVSLPTSTVEVSTVSQVPAAPIAVVVIAHGAGAGMDHPFLEGFAAGIVGADMVALRFTFPYLEAGRRMPGPAAHATATWEAIVAEAAREYPALPIVAAGKSYGGRMASLAAAESRIDPAALVYLGYPLHPPGAPDKLRASHLPDISAPQLFVEGTNDPFIDPHEHLEAAVASCHDAEVVWVDGGGHSFDVKGMRRPADEIGRGLAAPVAAWIARRVMGAGAPGQLPVS